MKDLIKKYLTNNDKLGELGIDYNLQDDGEGVFISYWNEEKLGEKPTFTEEELSEGEVQEKIGLKLTNLDVYHSNSPGVRTMTINGYFILSLSSTGRNLIAEQIQQLKQKIEKGILTEETAVFEYFYNGGSVEITLSQLESLHIFMLDTVNTNYGVYKAHIFAINNLTSIEDEGDVVGVTNYDFTANYLKNQNLDI